MNKNMTSQAKAQRPDAVIITGPTAVGKTDLSLAVARDLDAEIISLDSRPVYRGLDVGTAKPTAAERAAVPHHLIDILDPGERFTVSDFITRSQAAARITPVHASHADFLAGCEPGSYDAVYFDPMFERTVQASTMMQRIREVAVDDALSPDLLHRAVKIARRRVAVKCRRGEFMDFAFDDFIPSGGSVGYAVVKCS